VAEFLPDEHFELYTALLTSKLGTAKNKKSIVQQKEKVERLVSLENDFREALKLHPAKSQVMAAFVHLIRKDYRKILLAQPYFRERSEVFNEHISDMFFRNSGDEMLNHHVNGYFVQWYLLNFKHLHEPHDIFKITDELMAQRSEIIETNLPLAISRARLFWKKTQRSHLSYMDIMQTASEGLINAVDKYVLPFGVSFRSVICGRITGDLIAAYSRPVLSFPPKDAKRLYHANKSIRFASGPDDLVQRMNEKLPDNCKTTPDEIRVLMNAASHFSIDSPPTLLSEKGESPRQKTTFVNYLKADDSVRPDVQAEQNDMQAKLLVMVKQLPVLARKVLAMRGFNVDDMFGDL
jgi:DNA-directed RNA polymerase specialized sigma subunit